MAEEETKKATEEGAVVYIGNKPFMNYVTGVVMQFNTGVKTVSIKARGKHISRAVDVTEAVKNKFIKELKVKNIKIGSEEFEGKSGRNVRVSTIEIEVEK